MARVLDVERMITMGLYESGRSGGRPADSPAKEQLMSAGERENWDFISPFQQPDVNIDLGTKMSVKGFDVRLFGATGCLVAVETVSGASVADITADALAGTGLGVHPNILNLVAAQRKVIARADGGNVTVVELVWEYVKGYSLEKMILSGGLYVYFHFTQ
jgi:hypothetical protein